MKALDKLNVPYYVVIEEQEFDNYSKVIDKDKILILPFSVPNSNSELVKSIITLGAISLVLTCNKAVNLLSLLK